MSNINESLVFQLNLDQIGNNPNVKIEDDKVIGKCLSFNAEQSNFVAVEFNEPLKIRESFTVSVWFYITENSSTTDLTLFSTYGSPERWNCAVICRNNKLLFIHDSLWENVVNITSPIYLEQDLKLQEKTWHHFTAIFNPKPELLKTYSNIESLCNDKEIYNFYINGKKILNYQQPTREILGNFQSEVREIPLYYKPERLNIGGD